MIGLPIYTNPVPDSLIAFSTFSSVSSSFALKNVTRSNFELSVAEFKINRDENEDGDLDTDHYKVNPRDFFIPTQLLGLGKCKDSHDGIPRRKPEVDIHKWGEDVHSSWTTPVIGHLASTEED
ncbi:hypothetical protein L6452_09821 [Arctium lappa]|uniref:Uncharacterized protein n=1 Tax=Arctium lappa TaxID=4217 RepID=A0ACB9DLD0_ARCLA|nr:hypothetical protein L6452_09821 [Arctium lappa]